MAGRRLYRELVALYRVRHAVTWSVLLPYWYP
jgi:alcohol dehydrogenase YqhD (iron-dependent ADH family)